MKIEDRTGKRVPDVTFRTRRDGQWVDVTSQSLFGGRRVVLFALPGAFTPTCSSAHLPRYDELYDEFRKAGVDDVICLSVNDAFTMDAWGRDLDVSQVRLLGDGNAEFSRGMGMCVDKADLGFGPRSWRYAMVVDDGVIEKMFIEPQRPGDPYEISDADHVLGYLNPKRAPEEDIAILTRDTCPHCARAKSMLKAAGLRYVEIPLVGARGLQTLRGISGATTVPQVFVGGRRIGGADDLERWLAQRGDSARKS
ncbi:MAG TPA: glutathione peroxidase [Myxococcota bacterium]|jgi:glutaredoxin-like protein|nr:glutathione peroxidase [Myxococcota bacterium]